MLARGHTIGVSVELDHFFPPDCNSWNNCHIYYSFYNLPSLKHSAIISLFSSVLEGSSACAPVSLAIIGPHHAVMLKTGCVSERGLCHTNNQHLDFKSIKSTKPLKSIELYYTVISTGCISHQLKQRRSSCSLYTPRTFPSH